MLSIFLLLLLYVLAGTVRSMGYDEAFTACLALADFPTFYGNIRGGAEVNMALYYVILRSWLSLTNLLNVVPTELVVRFPSAVFATVAVSGMYLIARCLFSRLAAIAVSLLFALSTNSLFYASEARSYSLYVACTIAGYYCLFRILSGTRGYRETTLLWLAYVLSMSAGIMAHLITVTFVGAQVLFYSLMLVLPTEWRNQARQQWRFALRSLAAIIVVSSPILALAGRYGGSNSWIPRPSPQSLLNMYASSALGCDSFTITMLLYGVILLGTIAALFRMTGEFKTCGQKAALQPPNSSISGFAVGVLTWAIVPVLGAYILSTPPFNQRLILSRYQLAAYAPLFLLVGCAFWFLRRKLISTLLAALLILCSLGNLYVFYIEPLMQPAPPGLAITRSFQWLEQRYQPGDGVVSILGSYGASDMVKYYLDYAWPHKPARFGNDSPGGYGGNPRWKNPIDQQLLSQYAEKHRRVFVVTSMNDLKWATTTDWKSNRKALAKYKLIEKIENHEMIIELYQTATTR